MDRFSKFVFFVMCLVFAGTVCLVCHAFAQTRSGLSTDELLEYTLDALRDKMDSAVARNRDLSAKNTSIRTRMLSLKKEMREWDDAMIRLRQESIDIKNDIRLQAEELKLQEKHLNNVMERKRHLEYERDSLEAQIDTLRIERDLAVQNIEETKFDIQEVKGSLKGPGRSALLDYYSEEKLRFYEMIKDYQQRVANKQANIDRLETDMSNRLRSKEVALRENETLKRTVADLEFQFQEEQARTSLLRRARDQREKQKDRTGQALRTGNQQRREYVRELTNSIRDMDASNQKAAERFKTEEKDIRRMLDLLEQENKILFGYKQVLEQEKFLRRRNDDQDHIGLVLQNQYDELRMERDRLKSEKTDIENAVVKQKNNNESFKRDAQRFQKTNDDLAREVEAVKEKVAVVRKDAFGQKQDALWKAIDEQTARNRALEQDISVLKNNQENQKQRLVAERDMKAQIEQEIKKLNEATVFLQNEEKKLSLRKDQLARLAEENRSDFEEGLEEARMRRKALAASLDVINKKYQAGEDQPGNFDAEQAELMRYLDVLKKENQGLQNTLLELQKKSSS